MELDLLTLLQTLGTPLLVVLGVMSYRALNALHDIDKRVAIIESHLNVRKTNE